MDIIFSSKGMLFLDALLALWFIFALQGQATILFSPQGRISRLTYWEGFTAWLLLNVAFIILGIAHSATGFHNQLATNFGDTDHVWYHRLVMFLVMVHCLVSSWIAIVLCAKRWHDLNFSGWLALVSALPVLTLSYAWYTFLESLGRTMNFNLATDPHYSPFDLWRQMLRSGLPHLSGWSAWSFVFSIGMMVALGAYLGFARGDAGANPYGKTTV